MNSKIVPTLSPGGLDWIPLTESAPNIPIAATPARSKRLNKICKDATIANFFESDLGRIENTLHNSSLVEFKRIPNPR
jgi:hypothetical protein